MYNLLHKVKILHKIDRYIMSENFCGFKILDSIYKKLSFKKIVLRNNQKIIIHVKHGVGLQNLIGQYEDWFYKLLKKLELPKNCTIIDVGANSGQTLLKIVPFYSSQRYIAIEPNKYCINYLSELCKNNNFNNVEIFSTALSDKNETTKLFYRYREDILGTTTPDYRKFTNYSNIQEVNSITGDDLCINNNIENISLIKIDVEGGEYKVIKGLINTIKKYNPFIICEILPTATESNELTKHRIELTTKLYNLVSELEYTIVNITQNKLITSIADLSQDIEACNYILFPKEYISRFIKTEYN